MAVGLLRDVLIVQKLGFSFYADMILVVLLVPSVLENVLGFVARDTAAVAFSSAASRPSHELARFAVVAACVVVGIAFVIAGCLYLASEPLLRVLAPGWNPMQRAEAQPAVLLASAIVFLQTVVYFFIGYENFSGRYMVSAVRPMVLGLAGVAALYLAADSSVPVVFIASQSIVMAMFALILLIAYWRGNRLSIGLHTKSAGHAPSITFSVGVIPISALVVMLHQIPFVIERSCATIVAPGAAILLSFVYRLVTIPLSLFAASVLAMMVPALLRERQSGARSASRASQGLSATLALGILSMGFFVAFKGYLPFLVGLVGITVDSGVARFSDVVLAYSIGIPGFFVSLYLIKVGIVYEKSDLLLLPGVVGVSVQLLAAKTLVSLMGASGIALATSLFFISFSVLSFVALSKYIPLRVDCSLVFRAGAACLLAFSVVSALPKNESGIGIVVAALAFSGVLAVSMRYMGDARLMTRRYWQGLFYGDKQ